MAGRFFGMQATRLLRESWGDTNELAEELYAMATSTGPIATDQPLQLTTDGTQPAITIFQNGNSDIPPIQIIKNYSPDDPQQTCCNGTIGNSGPNNAPGGGGPKKNKTILGSPPGGGGDVGPGGGGPGDPIPNRVFFGELQIRLHMNAPDTFHFDGQEPSFFGGACLPYKPPLINGPGSAFAIASVVDALNSFLALPTVAPFFGSYEVILDKVNGPLGTCTP